MLQNPSKYHPNPLSHFLALHNSQAAIAHNARNTNNTYNSSHILTNVSAFGFGGGGSTDDGVGIPGHSQSLHHQQQQQQHTHTLLMTAQQEQQNSHHHYNFNATTHAHPNALLDATGTTLDVGKSFTIAAILGLQSRNSIDINHRKEYNNVINLSLNGNNDHYRQQQQTPHCSTPPPSIGREEANKSNTGGSSRISDDCPHSRHSNSNNNNESNTDECNKTDLTITSLNKFHCDTSVGLMNSYLNTSNGTGHNSSSTGTPSTFMASAQQQQHQQHHAQLHHSSHQTLMSSHVRANSFAAAAAVAAVAAANVNAVVNGAPTALQSLQQLHHHHAQQTGLTFPRDKLKPDNHAKKSSLKNKRVRTIFTPEQLERLEAEFERQQYMVGPERLYLAHTLQLTEAQVKVWFQNRRIKWRKHHLEITQQRLALLRQNQLPPSNAVPDTTLPRSPDGLVTPASNSSFDENDEPNEPNPKHEGLAQIDTQGHNTESDSELSICNDSMDADSINDGGEDT